MTALNVGAARADVTPPVKNELAGHGHRIAEGLHDPLFAKVLYLETKRERFALVTTDLLGFDLDFTKEVRALAREYTGLAPAKVLLTASHTHSGPHLRTLHGEFSNPAYRRVVIEKIAGAIYEATRNARPAAFGWGRGELRESVNRRVNMPDGRHFYLPRNRHLQPFAKEPTDPEVGVLSFRTPKGDPVATLVNYTAHAICVGLGSPFISADYPGVMQQVIESKLGGVALFANGACGDVHPIGFESGHERAKIMGEALAREALRVAKRIRHSRSVNLRTLRAAVKLPLRKDVIRKKDAVLVARKDCEGFVGYAAKFLRMKAFDTEMQAVALGDVALVGAPGELLVEIGSAIKRASPFRATYILYNANDYVGYIPHLAAYREGGYEEATLLASDAGRIVEKTALAMLKRVAGRR
jgi:hypothetical protein